MAPPGAWPCGTVPPIFLLAPHGHSGSRSWSSILRETAVPFCHHFHGPFCLLTLWPGDISHQTARLCKFKSSFQVPPRQRASQEGSVLPHRKFDLSCLSFQNYFSSLPGIGGGKHPPLRHLGSPSDSELSLPPLLAHSGGLQLTSEAPAPSGGLGWGANWNLPSFAVEPCGVWLPQLGPAATCTVLWGLCLGTKKGVS